MDVLDHLAQAAAVILLIELLVVLLLFLAIAGGLAFGLRWVRGKSDPLFARANSVVRRVPGYVERASDVAASPVIKLAGIMRNVKVTAETLRGYVRGGRPTRPAPVQTAPVETDMDATVEIAARPAPSPGEATESIEPASLV